GVGGPSHAAGLRRRPAVRRAEGHASRTLRKRRPRGGTRDRPLAGWRVPGEQGSRRDPVTAGAMRPGDETTPPGHTRFGTTGQPVCTPDPTTLNVRGRTSPPPGAH